MNMLENSRQKVYETWEKCQRLSVDSSTTASEREAAAIKAKELRKKLDGEIAPEADAAGFQNLIKQGQEIVEGQKNINWKLGELATQVDKEYGKDKLKEFAEAIGVNQSTLKNCRSTFLAWPEKDRRRSISFSIASELNAHPRHVEILEKNPDITKAQARAKMKEYKEREAVKAPSSKKKAAAKKAIVTAVDPAERVEEAIEIASSSIRKDGALSDLISKISKLEVSDKDRTRLVKALDQLLTRVEKLITIMGVVK